MSNKLKFMKQKKLTYQQKVILFACEALEDLAEGGFITGQYYRMGTRARFELEALKAEGFEPLEDDLLTCAEMLRDELGFSVVGDKDPVLN